jgi:hypothetical protein
MGCSPARRCRRPSAARLLVDLLGQVHDALLAAAIDDEALVTDVVFVRKLDDLLASITTIRIVGDVEVSREGEQKDSETTGAGVSLGFGPKPSAEVRLSTQGAEERRELLRETRRGTEQRILNFSDVARALRELAATLATRRACGCSWTSGAASRPRSSRSWASSSCGGCCRCRCSP